MIIREQRAFFREPHLLLFIPRVLKMLRCNEDSLQAWQQKLTSRNSRTIKSVY